MTKESKDKVQCETCKLELPSFKAHCLNPTFCSWECRESANKKRYDWVVKIQYEGKNYACYNVLNNNIINVIKRLQKSFQVNRYDKGKKTVPNLLEEVTFQIKKVEKKKI